MKLRFSVFLAVAAGLIFCASAGFGQVYSYLDENGVRVFTNIPPAGPVSDLKVSGQTPAPPADDARNNASSAARLKSSNRPAAVKTKLKAAEVDALVNKYAAEFSLDPKLLTSMIATESGYNPDAVSPKGAQGLMQLMPQTAARLGVSDPFDPEQNIWGGARYMRFLLDTFAENREDNLILSLAAYNAGENVVQRLGRIPDYRETNEYVRSIIDRYGKRQMEVPLLPETTIPVPPTFRYFDQNGVLILTNIPPVDRSRSAGTGGGPGLSSR